MPEQAGQAFLRELWGDGDAPGFLQTWTLHDKRSEYWPHWRGIQTDGQRDTFTAMGTTPRRHGAKHRAKAEQVCAIPGLWLDLDVKEGHLPDMATALALASTYATATILVASGYGIHAYYLLDDGPWIFKSTADRDEAASLARRWFTLHQQTAAARDWHVDQLGDLARLMRLPGTLNCKQPENPRPVRVLRNDGPRYATCVLRKLLHDVPDQPTGPTSLFDGTVALTGDTSAYAAKFDALIANSPEFAAVWKHERVFPSLSEADLSLCSLAAGAMTDPELAVLIATHRAYWGDPKGRRADYVARTIRRARSAPPDTGQESSVTTCDWCAQRAVTTIEIEPVQMGIRAHPVTGFKMRVPVQRAKTANACAEHAEIRDRKGGTQIADPRRQKANVEQLDIYDALGGEAA